MIKHAHFQANQNTKQTMHEQTKHAQKSATTTSWIIISVVSTENKDKNPNARGI